MPRIISIIIPAFNEEKTIAKTIEKVLAQESPGWQKEIIAVDDGSIDSTPKILEKFSDKVLIVRQKNMGKGSALIKGFSKCSGELIIVQDADLEYNPADWPAMLEEFDNNPGIAAIYGSRELGSSRKGYFLNVLGVRLLTFFINFLFGARLTDSYTCYKLIKADFLKKLDLKSRGFEIEAEITCRILKNGGVIKEVPISYSPRTFSEGKKIRLKDEISGIAMALKCRFYD
jgi:glycosyltransferase involved in cell wall biosynthesis